MSNFHDAFDLAGIRPGEAVFLAFDISMNPPMAMQARMFANLIEALRDRDVSAATIILTDSKVQDIQTFFPRRFEQITKMRLGRGSGAMFNEAVDDAIRLKAPHLFIVGDGLAVYPPTVATAGIAITTVTLGKLLVDEPRLHGPVIEVDF